MDTLVYFSPEFAAASGPAAEFSPPRRCTAMIGLFSRRERWGLTWRGWVALAGLAVVLALAALLLIHPFLALKAPLSGDILVVEGWIPEYALRDCLEFYNDRSYQEILSVGGPVSGADYPAAEDDTYAYVAARKFAKLGMSKGRVHMVATNLRTRDRTYSSALAAREWLSKRGELPATLTVATLGPHARRTRLLYQKAFGRQTRIGVIAIDNREYDPARWWRYSEGVKEVVSEGSAYIYARFLFRPSPGVQTASKI